MVLGAVVERQHWCWQARSMRERGLDQGVAARAEAACNPGSCTAHRAKWQAVCICAGLTPA